MTRCLYNYRIYRNLHKSCWSVQHYVPKVGWRLMEHLDSLTAINCTTKVYEANRQKVIETKKKNVHAYILAEKIEHHGDCVMLPSGRPMRYNPYRLPHFYTWDENDEVVEVPEFLAQITLMADGKVIV